MTEEKHAVSKYDNNKSTKIAKIDKTITKLGNKTKLRGLIFYGSGLMKRIYGKRWIGSPWLNLNLSFVGMENVEYIDVTDNRIDLDSGIFLGVSGLKTFIVSGSEMSSFSAQTADTIPAVEILGLANLKFDLNIFQSTSSRIFKNLKSLMRLELSSNSLSFLTQNTFSTNNQMT